MTPAPSSFLVGAEESLEPEIPFGPKGLAMLPVRSVTHVSGLDRDKLEPSAGPEPATCRLRIERFYGTSLLFSASMLAAFAMVWGLIGTVTCNAICNGTFHS
jgi:hypothetical protein